MKKLFLLIIISAKLFSYSTTNIQILYGTFDYAIADDRFKYHDDKTDLYGEFSPRVSFSKIFSQDFSLFFIKEIYLAGQYNIGEDYEAYLYGIGSDLDILGFSMFGRKNYE